MPFIRAKISIRSISIRSACGYPADTTSTHASMLATGGRSSWFFLGRISSSQPFCSPSPGV